MSRRRDKAGQGRYPVADWIPAGDLEALGLRREKDWTLKDARGRRGASFQDQGGAHGRKAATERRGVVRQPNEPHGPPGDERPRRGGGHGPARPDVGGDGHHEDRSSCIGKSRKHIPHTSRRTTP